MGCERRAFLSGAAVSVVTAAGGCLGAPPGDDDENDTETGTDDTDDGENDPDPELTGYAVSEQVVTPSTERYSDMDAWGLYLATREVADRYFGDVTETGAEDVRTFVDETAFDAGDRLLYLHAFAPQTCYDLVLAGKPRIAQNGRPLVETEVTRTTPADEPCGDAVTPVRLLCRLSFDPDAGAADILEATVSGHRDDVEELLLEVER